LSSVALAGVAAHVGPYGAGFGWLFFLIPLFWIALFVVLFGVFGRRWRRRAFSAGYAGHGPWAHAGRGAESTLAERFANGDIDEIEYRARLEVLRANNYPTPPER
jgi:putative membrane protein